MYFYIGYVQGLGFVWILIQRKIHVYRRFQVVGVKGGRSWKSERFAILSNLEHLKTFLKQLKVNVSKVFNEIKKNILNININKIVDSLDYIYDCFKVLKNFMEDLNSIIKVNINTLRKVWNNNVKYLINNWEVEYSEVQNPILLIRSAESEILSLKKMLST